MSIYVPVDDFLDEMFLACSSGQINEFIPERRGFRLHGHSTSICLERMYWDVLEDMARDCGLTLPRLVEKVHDGCLVANERNIASCLRVICAKYLRCDRPRWHRMRGATRLAEGASQTMRMPRAI